jgi:hypothetical protein
MVGWLNFFMVDGLDYWIIGLLNCFIVVDVN